MWENIWSRFFPKKKKFVQFRPGKTPRMVEGEVVRETEHIYVVRFTCFVRGVKFDDWETNLSKNSDCILKVSER